MLLHVGRRGFSGYKNLPGVIQCMPNYDAGGRRPLQRICVWVFLPKNLVGQRSRGRVLLNVPSRRERGEGESLLFNNLGKGAFLQAAPNRRAGRLFYSASSREGLGSAVGSRPQACGAGPRVDLRPMRRPE